MSAALIANLPFDQLAALALGMMAAGLLAGFVAGLLGVGGGIVLVPVLAEVLTFLQVESELRVPIAVGTSLATVLPTAWRSVHGHNKKGAVDWRVLRRWAGPTFAGTLIGMVLARFIGGAGLALVFGCGAAVLALYLAFGREGWRLGPDPMAAPAAWGWGAGNGALSAMMGIGGGSFGVSLLMLYGVAIHRAVGTAAGFGLIIAIPGMLGMIVNGWGQAGLPPFSLGYVNLLATALIVPATMLTTPLGVSAAHRLSRLALRRIFAIFLAITALRMLSRLL